VVVVVVVARVKWLFGWWPEWSCLTAHSGWCCRKRRRWT